eukprot:779918-Pleurochrysis_carterae.AAC.4
MRLCNHEEEHVRFEMGRFLVNFTHNQARRRTWPNALVAHRTHAPRAAILNPLFEPFHLPSRFATPATHVLDVHVPACAAPCARLRGSMCQPARASAQGAQPHQTKGKCPK